MKNNYIPEIIFSWEPFNGSLQKSRLGSGISQEHEDRKAKRFRTFIFNDT